MVENNATDGSPRYRGDDAIEEIDGSAWAGLTIEGFLQKEFERDEDGKFIHDEYEGVLKHQFPWEFKGRIVFWTCRHIGCHGRHKKCFHRHHPCFLLIGQHYGDDRYRLALETKTDLRHHSSGVFSLLLNGILHYNFDSGNGKTREENIAEGFASIYGDDRDCPWENCSQKVDDDNLPREAAVNMLTGLVGLFSRDREVSSDEFHGEARLAILAVEADERFELGYGSPSHTYLADVYRRNIGGCGDRISSFFKKYFCDFCLTCDNGGFNFFTPCPLAP